MSKSFINKCIFVCVAAMVSILFIKITTSSFAQIAKSSDSKDKIDANTYSIVQKLRQALALTNGDLAAMGCSEDEAKVILESVVSWVKANQSTLENARVAHKKAQTGLRIAIQKMNIGPKKNDPSASSKIASYKAEVSRRQAVLSRTEQALKQVRSGLISLVSSKMDSSKQAVWKAAQANSPGAYRYVPSLTNKQHEALKKASTQKTRLNVSGKLKEAAGLISQTEAKVLNASQRKAIVTAKANQQKSMANVLKAEAAILPIPKELKESAEGMISK